MILTAQVKLVVDHSQSEKLLALMTGVNRAATWLAPFAFARKCADRNTLQKTSNYYKEIRRRFGLSANHTIRAIAKLCGAYKRDLKILPVFRDNGAIEFDKQIYSFKDGLDQVSLQVLDGRILLPTRIGEYQRKKLEGERGAAKLYYKNGEFYLLVSYTEPKKPLPVGPVNWLGVDLGITNLAVDSDGDVHTGAKVLAVASRLAEIRSRLQSCGTKSAKRHVRKIGKKESRFRKHTNHVISKKIVQKAQDTSRGIAVEDLTGIRRRVTVRKARRAVHHSWAFYQLRLFIEYKAKRAGVPTCAVDPRNTSRTCPECGCCSKKNRTSQALFSCIRCGYAANADLVGARNIASRGYVISPDVEEDRLGVGLSTTLPAIPLQSLAL